MLSFEHREPRPTNSSYSGPVDRVTEDGGRRQKSGRGDADLMHEFSIAAAALLMFSGTCSNPEDRALRFREPMTRLRQSLPPGEPIVPE